MKLLFYWREKVGLLFLRSCERPAPLMAAQRQVMPQQIKVNGGVEMTAGPLDLEHAQRGWS